MKLCDNVLTKKKKRSGEMGDDCCVVVDSSAVPSRVSLLSSLPCVQCKFKIYIILFSSTLPAASSGVMYTNKYEYSSLRVDYSHAALLLTS